MNFAFSDEQQALRDQARKFLSDRAAPARVRRILESDEPFDRELWRGMGELAWTGTAIPESYGGAGFGYLELCVLAEELGRSLAPTPPQRMRHHTNSEVRPVCPSQEMSDREGRRCRLCG